jgi:hypothetical protein
MAKIDFQVKSYSDTINFNKELRTSYLTESIIFWTVLIQDIKLNKASNSYRIKINPQKNFQQDIMCHKTRKLQKYFTVGGLLQPVS